MGASVGGADAFPPGRFQICVVASEKVRGGLGSCPNWLYELLLLVSERSHDKRAQAMRDVNGVAHWDATLVPARYLSPPDRWIPTARLPAPSIFKITTPRTV